MEIKNHCIYLQDEQSKFTYNSGEHIIPAGLGGIQKLPGGYVSDLCNNTFSGIETEFMRRSPITLPRQFYGPGKRGNLNEKNATKSEVGLMYDPDFPIGIKLGYISLGKPYSLPQIIVDSNRKFLFTTNAESGDGVEQLNNFISQLKKFKHKYKIHEDEKMDKGSFIIGYEKAENKWHVVCRNKEDKIDIEELMEIMLNPNKYIISDPQHKSIQPEVNQKFLMNVDAYFRVYAKIAFNYLAYTKGQEFVLQDRFNPIRNWIVNGGNNNFVGIILEEEISTVLDFIDFPDLSHKIILTNISDDLMAFISFYGGQFNASIHLSDNFKEDIFEGFICDWKNRKEESLFNYINRIKSNMEGIW